MAMDYKILKTLEIGGDKMGVDTDVGKEYMSNKTGINLTANTYNKSAQITVPETGLYAIECYSVFQAAGTTGTTKHTVGWGTASGTIPNFFTDIMDASNITKRQSHCWVALLNKNQVVANFTLSNKDISNCSAQIRIIRLLSY